MTKFWITALLMKHVQIPPWHGKVRDYSDACTLQRELFILLEYLSFFGHYYLHTICFNLSSVFLLRFIFFLDMSAFSLHIYVFNQLWWFLQKYFWVLLIIFFLVFSSGICKIPDSLPVLCFMASSLSSFSDILFSSAS